MSIRLLVEVRPSTLVSSLTSSRAVGAGELEHGVELVGGQRDGDALAAPGVEAVAVGERARSPRGRRPAARRPSIVPPIAIGCGGDRRGDRDIGGRRRRLQPVGAGLAGAEAGHRDPIGAVGGELRGRAGCASVSPPSGIVIGEVEAVGAGHHQIGIEGVGGEVELDALPAPALRS